MGKDRKIKRNNTISKRRNDNKRKSGISKYTSSTLSNLLSPLTTLKKNNNGEIVETKDDPFSKSNGLKTKKSQILTKKIDISKNKIKQKNRKLKEELENTNLEEISMLVSHQYKKNEPEVIDMEKINEQKRINEQRELQNQMLDNDFEEALAKLGSI